MVFIQETHSDSVNEWDWKREWPGEVFLSHKWSNSAGVGIPFSRAFSPHPVEVLDIMSGLYENVNVVFFVCLCSGFKY